MKYKSLRPRGTPEEIHADVRGAVLKATRALKNSWESCSKENVIKRAKLYVKVATNQHIKKYVDALDEQGLKEHGFPDANAPRQKLETRPTSPSATAGKLWRTS